MNIDQTAEPNLALMHQHAAGLRWPTLGVLALCCVIWSGALFLPMGWGALQWVLLVFALTLHSSLSHEILHDGFFRSAWANRWLGLFQPGVFVPFLRFRALHLEHHRDADLTDPYDDPESAYLDPRVWAGLPVWCQRVLWFNNTLLGRMLVGPVIGMVAFMRSDVRRIIGGDRVVLSHWLAHLPGVALTLWLVSLSSLSVWAYLSACYGALSVLRIRTFLEHRAHERSAGRSVVIEDRGILAFLFLNNNFHAVHHAHPQVAWYDLPALYRTGKDKFLLGNQGYVYRSYAQIFRQYFLCAKDPVAHPLWQPKDE
ncbi:MULTISPECIES: fatty acid desaturase [unclassified Sulfitobacter]|uniref:fatty acid desaturase n=1 Tax=unclassified Sulfitobacter TaxID=196795 RepID=UPI0023E1FD85|nr:MULTISPECIES: fatty acid desaturase [unclassified Sulfitobacter]